MVTARADTPPKAEPQTLDLSTLKEMSTTALTKINLATAPIDLAPGLPTAKASGSAKTNTVPATIPDATVRAMPQAFSTPHGTLAAQLDWHC